jgi:2-polyprenyl-3-methyl-5-hydroxy-6-metoxy-1,4-benzoquinol methylase
MSQNKECRVCNSRELEEILDLGNQPWGNGFINSTQFKDEKEFPLTLVRCAKCSLAQLDYTIPKEQMFISHTYLSGTTSTLNQHFESLARSVFQKFLSDRRDKIVLDIGSNDGTQLKHYKQLGCEVLGVESAPHAVAIALSNGIRTDEEFFNLEYAQRLSQKFDVINASGVFFHLEELHSVCEGVRHSLKQDGVFIVQFIYMKTMQENIAFDQIYHEHLLYYTVNTLSTLLNMHGLEIFDAQSSDIHGGSIIAYVSHPGSFVQTETLKGLIQEEINAGTNDLNRYKTFSMDTKMLKQKTLDWFDLMQVKEQLIYGLGAPVKGNTLINYFGLSVDNLPYLIERNPLRKGLYSPGAHIPVLMEDEIPRTPDAYFVLAWNFKSEILKRHSADVKQGVDFFFPIDPAQ